MPKVNTFEHTVYGQINRSINLNIIAIVANVVFSFVQFQLLLLSTIALLSMHADPYLKQSIFNDVKTPNI